MLLDMLHTQFERAGGGQYSPKSPKPPTAESSQTKAEKAYDFLTAKDVTADDKKLQFTAMLESGLDVASLRTPDTQDVRYGLFPWVSKRLIQSDSLLHACARVYGTEEERQIFGFSPLETYMIYHAEKKGAESLREFLESYTINVPDFDASGPLFGISRGLVKISLMESLCSHGRERLQSFLFQIGVGEQPESLMILTEARVVSPSRHP